MVIKLPQSQLVELKKYSRTRSGTVMSPLSVSSHCEKGREQINKKEKENFKNEKIEWISKK